MANSGRVLPLPRGVYVPEEWAPVSNSKEPAGTPSGDCGTGAGGFREGNTCAGGGGNREELVSKWVSGPENISPSERARLVQEVLRSSTSRPALIRVSASDPKYQCGEVVNFTQPTATTSSVEKVLGGGAVGEIGWKSDDGALILVEGAKRGIDVDYKKVKSSGFSASGERETILAGPYRVKDIRKVTEPGTEPQYGYKVKMYVLEEVGSPTGNSESWFPVDTIHNYDPNQDRDNTGKWTSGGGGGSGSGGGGGAGSGSGGTAVPPAARSRAAAILDGAASVVGAGARLAVGTVKVAAKVLTKGLQVAYERYGDKGSICTYIVAHTIFSGASVATGGGAALAGAALFGLASVEVRNAVAGFLGLVSPDDRQHATDMAKRGLVKNVGWVEVDNSDCGTGAGGFKPGNTCAGGVDQRNEMEGFSIGDKVSVLHQPSTVVDFGQYKDLKDKYPSAAKKAVEALPPHLDESKLGRTWVLEDKNGEHWMVGVKALKLFVKKQVPTGNAAAKGKDEGLAQYILSFLGDFAASANLPKPKVTLEEVEALIAETMGGGKGTATANEEWVPVDNVFCPTGEGGGVDPTCSPETSAPSAKSARAKASAKRIDRNVQRYAEEGNEARLAALVEGKPGTDSQPADVITKDGDGVELKTMVDNSNSKITMDTYAQVRKLNWESEQGKTFHTVIADDTKVMNALGEGQHDDSARVYYYRRGVAGSARLSSLLKVESDAELKRVMSLPEEELPKAAQRTDAKLRVGKWEPIIDEGRKAFRNSETGRVVRAKK